MYIYVKFKEKILKIFNLDNDSYHEKLIGWLNNYDYDFDQIEQEEKKQLDKEIETNKVLDNTVVYINNNKLNVIVMNVPTIAGHTTSVNFVIE